MQLQFAKYHGLGNDFVIINNIEGSLSLSKNQIAFICDRHFGIGADGLIFARTSDNAEFFMDYYNSDGSIAEMCGNGIRCYVKYLHDEKMTEKKIIDIETRAGILPLELIFDSSGTVIGAKVDMGEPILEAEKIPVALNANNSEITGNNNSESTGGNIPDIDVEGGNIYNRVVDVPFMVDDEIFHATCVSMGNPHCVTFVDDTTTAPVQTIGPKIEVSEYFPQKTNVEFAKIISRNEIELRVWERGCGETMACGTGACATLVAAVLSNKADRSAVVHLPGGDLNIEWLDNNHISMQGPAIRVFTGSIDI